MPTIPGISSRATTWSSSICGSDAGAARGAQRGQGAGAPDGAAARPLPALRGPRLLAGPGAIADDGADGVAARSTGRRRRAPPHPGPLPARGARGKAAPAPQPLEFDRGGCYMSPHVFASRLDIANYRPGPRLRIGDALAFSHLIQGFPMPTDYRPTVFLPKTDFPMRGDLPKREPVMLARWAAMDLYRRLRETAAGREKFVLHDGPPYANGDSISATRSTRSSRMSSTARSRCWARTRPMCRAGTATACRSNGRSRRNTGRRSRRRTRSRPSSSAANAATSPRIGSRCRRASSSAWACSATGPTPIRRWPFRPRRRSSARSASSSSMAGSTAAPSR